MKKTLIFVHLAILAFVSEKAWCQGTFGNLGFESAVIMPDPASPYYPEGVYASNAIPGWTAYIGGVPQTDIIYNDISLGGAWISLHGPGSSQPILSGTYSLLLQPSTVGPPISVGVAQTGRIPQNAESLTFYGTGVYTVTFAGQPIPLVILASTPDYEIFAGDISSFANQTGELRFQGGGMLDNIVFSSQPVPEPSVLGIFGLGVVGYVLRPRKRGQPLESPGQRKRGQPNIMAGARRTC
jgi:hypothetical protein